MRLVQCILAALALASSAPVLAASEHVVIPSTVASSLKLRALFTPDQLPCHVAGVASCVDSIQKGFFACGTQDLDCQCESLIQLELSCYGICPQSQLLVEIASTINEVCSSMVSGTEQQHEPAFIDADDEEPNYTNADDGVFPLDVDDYGSSLDFDDDGAIVYEDKAGATVDNDALPDSDVISENESGPALPEAEAEESDIMDQDESITEEANDLYQDNDVALEETEDVDAGRAPSVSVDNVSEAGADTINPDVAESADHPEATEFTDHPEATEFTDYPAVSEYTDYPEVSEYDGQDTGAAQDFFEDSTTSEPPASVESSGPASVPQAIPESAPVSPMVTPVPAPSLASAPSLNDASASVTSVAMFVPAHTVMTDTDTTMIVTYPHFAGYTDMPMTAAYPVAAVATGSPRQNVTSQDNSQANTTAPYSVTSNSTGMYGNYYNSSAGYGYYANNSAYGNTSANYTHNGTYPEVYDSSSHTLGITASAVLAVAIGVVVALF